MIWRKIGLALLSTAWIAFANAQQVASITVASTTSTEQSGLFGYLLPRFAKTIKINVKVVAVATSQALDIGRRGDADVVFIHDRPAEDKFIAEAQGVKRFDVMYNDFVIVGPKSDPAHITGDKDVVDALRKIAAAKASFISRGDRSGTHEAELRLWKAASIDVATTKDGWAWGQPSTWPRRRTPICFRVAAPGSRSGTVAMSPSLLKATSSTLVNPDKHPTVKAKEGQAFVDWLISPKEQDAIASYKVSCEQLFFPDASHY